MVKKTTTPDRSTAAAFPRYLSGEVLADSVALQWTGHGSWLQLVRAILRRYSGEWLGSSQPSSAARFKFQARR